MKRHGQSEVKKSETQQGYDLLQSENAALKATVVDFAIRLRKLGLLELEDVSVDNRPKLAFDTSYGKRHDIMMYFVEMMSKGLIDNTEKSLLEFLSETTNLGTVSAIKRLYYRCQHEYVRK